VTTKRVDLSPGWNNERGAVKIEKVIVRTGLSVFGLAAVAGALGFWLDIKWLLGIAKYCLWAGVLVGTIPPAVALIWIGGEWIRDKTLRKAADVDQKQLNVSGVVARLDRERRIFVVDDVALTDLDVLKKWVGKHPRVDVRNAEILGLIAGLLASQSLSRTGMTLSLSNIFKTLDAYDLIFKDPQKTAGFDRGVDEALRLAREEASIEEVERALKRGKATQSSA
jgi:hypothetical protein